MYDACLCVHVHVTVLGKTNRLARKSLSHTRGNSRLSTKTLMEIKIKLVLLEDEALDWLKIWTMASLHDVKGKKGIKKYFSRQPVVFPK